MINEIKNFWFNISDKLRFLMVGGFNFCVSYLIFSLTVFILGENLYQISLAISWIISSIISFTTQRIFVFEAHDYLFKRYTKCCVTWFFSYLINAGLLELLVQKAELNVYLAQIIAVSCCAVFTYIMFKLFAFRNKS